MWRRRGIGNALRSRLPLWEWKVYRHSIRRCEGRNNWKNHYQQRLAVVFPREGASFVTQMVKNLPAKPETQVQSLGQEEPLEKRMAPHSSVLAWRIPWTEAPGGPQPMGSQRVGQDWAINTFPRECVLGLWGESLVGFSPFDFNVSMQLGCFVTI